MPSEVTSGVVGTDTPRPYPSTAAILSELTPTITREDKKRAREYCKDAPKGTLYRGVPLLALLQFATEGKLTSKPHHTKNYERVLVSDSWDQANLYAGKTWLNLWPWPKYGLYNRILHRPRSAYSKDIRSVLETGVMLEIDGSQLRHVSKPSELQPGEQGLVGNFDDLAPYLEPHNLTPRCRQMLKEVFNLDLDRIDTKPAH